MKITTAATVLLSAVAVRAGLEDAKFSTVLGAANFDSEIASVSVGTLTAFFAPWCGHCKSLEPAWTEAAKVYEGNSRCRIAHLDADDSKNKALASKFGVKGFPTLKFIHPDGTSEDYNTQRSAAAILAFMEEQGCGRSETEGRIPAFDEIASQFFEPGTAIPNPKLLAKAQALAPEPLSEYYLKIMKKYSESAEGAAEWILKEGLRLGKMANSKGNVLAKKAEELRSKQNILSAFTYVKQIVPTTDKLEEPVKDEL